MSSDWLILHAGALGDLILTLQLARRIRGVDESSRLHVVSRVDPGDLSLCRPAVRRTSSDLVGSHWLFARADHAAHESVADAPPMLVELVRGANVLSAISTDDSPAHPRLAALQPATLHGFHPRPDPTSRSHIVRQWQEQLERGGLRFADVPDAGFAVRAAARAATRQEPRPPGRVVAIHPGSGGRAKCWPLARFIEAARALRASGWSVRFVLGHVETERWTHVELQALTDEFPTTVESTPNQLVQLLARADVYLGNDSGPTHLAALLGTPALALFGPTSAQVWRPLGARVAALQGDAGSDDWGIEVDAVTRAVGELVRRRPT